MLLKKLLYIKVILILIVKCSLIHATIIDVEVMQLGKDIIILNKDQHHFDDSQEIWQATALLLLTTNPEKPADLILIEKNDVANKWDSLPDAFDSGTSTLDLHAKWVRNLKDILSLRNRHNSLQILKDLEFNLKADMYKHTNELSMLNLFYDVYVNYIAQSGFDLYTKFLSVDHRQASMLTYSCASDYFELFRRDIIQWQEQNVLPDILTDCDAIIKDLMLLPPIPLTNFYEEQFVIHQLQQKVRALVPNNPALSQKLDETISDNELWLANTLKAFVYLHDFNMFKNISIVDFKLRFKDKAINQEERSVLQKIGSMAITDILREGIKQQAEYIRDQLGYHQTRMRHENLSLFLQKRLSLFVTLNFESLLCTSQMVELESFIRILECLFSPHEQSKKIIVLGGVEHMQELAEMLEMMGAKGILHTDIINFVQEDPANSREAFEMCSTINHELLQLGV